MDKFSSRHGFESPDAEIKVRHESPSELRGIVVTIAYEAGLGPHDMRAIVCKVLRARDDPNNWSAFPNVDKEARDHLDSCEWYEVYDVIEAVHSNLVSCTDRQPWNRDVTPAVYYANEINKYFRKRGIGWQLIDGLIEIRGSESFESIIAKARQTLEESGRATASNEVHQALQDLSRRPQPDLTGAIQHALAALECVIRDVSGNHKLTLGALLSKYKGLVPAPLDQVLEKIWGFASEQGRHLREGKEPEQDEVELVVQIAAAAASYLVKKTRC